ncbi:MAG: choice-of-anchor N protein [Abditibacteriales bacterium]|nr:choice-of-anchor N protein [Abditibacteriales bacterium]
MNVLRVVVLGGILCLATSATWAAPNLQLYIDPSLNSNAAYNSISKGWETTANPMTLSAFMHGLSTAHTYRIIVSLPGRLADDNPNKKISVTVTDPMSKETVASLDIWTFGTPPLCHSGNAQSFHAALFPTWYATFDFTFSSDNRFTVFDVSTQQGETPGFRKDFLLTFSGPQSDTLYHFDLFNVETGEFAPLTHDAQRKPKRSSGLFPPVAFGFAGGGIGLLGGGGASLDGSGGPSGGGGGGGGSLDGSGGSGGPSGGGGGGGGSLGGSGGSGGPSGGGGGSGGFLGGLDGSGGSSGGGGGSSTGGSSGSSGGLGGNGGGGVSGGTGSPPASVTHTPEPSTIILLLTGAATFLVMQHRRRSKRQKT